MTIKKRDTSKWNSNNPETNKKSLSTREENEKNITFILIKPYIENG